MKNKHKIIPIYWIAVSDGWINSVNRIKKGKDFGYRNKICLAQPKRKRIYAA
jgi:uncharacterized protein YllA (UPF0747 family)